MPQAPRAGIVYLRVDGQQYDLSGSMTIGPSKVERESKVGLDGVHGFIEKNIVPFIEGEFVRNKNLSLQQIQDITDATIQAEFKDGTRYVLRNAWVTNAIELDAAEGTYTIRFEGEDMEEMGIEQS